MSEKNLTQSKELVKLETGEIVPFAPEKTIEEATKAARALQKVLDQKPKKIEIEGEQYLEFEDWQTLGWFYQVTAGAVETTEIWRENDLLGFSAKAVAYRNGQIISNAESSCLRTEKRKLRKTGEVVYPWREKSEFQLKSMAQTRACAKVLRNVLAWVAVLAGYKPTPSEEITEEITAEEIARDFSGEVETANGKKKCPDCGTVGRFHAPGCLRAQKGGRK